MKENDFLNIGDTSDNGQIEILDKDRLCYKVKSVSRGAYGIRTISKDLLQEYIDYVRTHSTANANEIRETLCGTSEIDRFEYGYTSTLFCMAKMVLSKERHKSFSKDYTAPQVTAKSSLQTIYYGAPGTGKSFEVNRIVGNDLGNYVRTTFHPDTDYATFVGAYKPTMKKVPRFNPNSGAQMGEEEKITYSFVAQAFLKAYVEAWRLMSKNPENPKPFYLVIEEINRGNCAQIFGDLFQLLDRNRNGFSSYGIVPDSDIQNFLTGDKKGLSKIDNIPDAIDDMGAVIATGKEIQQGAIMVLPSNLYILATMNTSDQSLFPIDSAFKRRWDWKYVPIAQGIKADGKPMEWTINANGRKYDWWQFLEKINPKIQAQTQSEDKKLGFFFIKAHDGVISAETFVSKVAFYLWNDVFKDYGYDQVMPTAGDDFTFPTFFQNTGGKEVNENQVARFIELIMGPREAENNDTTSATEG